VRDLKGMVALGRSGTGEPGSWRIPVLSTVASSGQGVDELLATLDQHRQHLREHGGSALRGRRRAQVAVQAVVLERVQQELSSAAGRRQLALAADQVASGSRDHHDAAQAVLDWLGRS